MLIVMNATADASQIEALVRHVEQLGLRAYLIPGSDRMVIAIDRKSVV
jgi:hypothetical protein